MSKSIEVNIVDVYLDTDNPRHDPISEQEDIIKHLLEDEEVKNLAKHIANNGLSPLDSIGIFKNDNDQYVVLEGNRRLCALHLLNNPMKAPSNLVNFFQKLMDASNKIPKAITCVLFDSIKEADTWKNVRHKGEQNGIGTRSWNAIQQARHDEKVGNRNANAMSNQIISYALDEGIIVQSQSKNIISALTRTLSTPFIRQTLGIASKSTDMKVKLNKPISEFNKGVQVLFENLCSKNGVLKPQSTSNERIEFAQRLLNNGTVSPTTVKAYELTNSSSNKKLASKVQQPGDSRSSHNPINRKYILPSKFIIKSNNNTLIRCVRDMKEIKISDHPIAVALLTRLFLELIYFNFYKFIIKKEPQPNQKTHYILCEITKKIDKSNLEKSQKSALKELGRLATANDHPLSPKTLGSYAHGGTIVLEREFKTAMDNILPILSYMLNEMHSND